MIVLIIFLKSRHNFQFPHSKRIIYVLEKAASLQATPNKSPHYLKRKAKLHEALSYLMHIIMSTTPLKLPISNQTAIPWMEVNTVCGSQKGPVLQRNTQH